MTAPIRAGSRSTVALDARGPADGQHPRRVALVGLAAIGVSYGFARYGYGLFLPQLRHEFHLSVAEVGLVGSAGYAGYLVAVVLVGLLTERLGPRAMVVVSGAAATVGMTLVALAPTASVLVAGLVLAGTSSGWAWAPFSDAVDRAVPATRRDRVLAIVAAGTAFGIVVAGPAALLASGSDWREAWLGFAVIASVVTLVSAATLPGRQARTSHRRPGLRLCWFLPPAAVRLYLTALLYGATGAVYWSFAVELVSAGSGTSTTTPLFWTVLGLSGTAAVAAGSVITRLGVARAHGALLTATGLATLLLGVAPHLTAVATVSALIYGAPFMAISGLLAIWSHQVFPDRPSSGFSAVVLFIGVGAIAGPAVIGAFADAYGLRTAFLLTAAVAFAAMLTRPRVRHE